MVADEKSIYALTRENLKEFVATYYAPNNSFLVIVGAYEKVKDQVQPFGDVTLFDAEGNTISKK